MLHAELYAVAALMVLGHMLGSPPALIAIVGAATCFALGYLALRRRWYLPVLRHRD